MMTKAMINRVGFVLMYLLFLAYSVLSLSAAAGFRMYSNTTSSGFVGVGNFEFTLSQPIVSPKRVVNEGRLSDLLLIELTHMH